MHPPTPLPVDLSGEVALVTGASSGLGRRMAVVLAGAGAAVAVAARRVERLESLVDEITARGGRGLAVPLDVADVGVIPAVVDAVQAALGPVTILVNNAGMADSGPATALPQARLEEILGTNVRGPWTLSVEVARRLIERGAPGRIVNVSSMAAHHHSGRGGAFYAVTKTALNRMTEALAIEWARHHINVNGIAPGAFATEMTDAASDRINAMIEAAPRRRIGDPEDLDSTLLFLVAPSSGMVTGTIIKVDDGQTPR